MIAAIILAVICTALGSLVTLFICKEHYTRAIKDKWFVNWIPLSKKLPKHGRCVLVAFLPTGKQTPRVFFSRRTNSGEFDIEKRGGGKVLAWAAMPSYRYNKINEDGKEYGQTREGEAY